MIVAAAGAGKRLGRDKLWINLAERTVISYTLEAASQAGIFDRVVIAAPQARWGTLRTLCALYGIDPTLIEGGEHRQDTVRLALKECADLAHVCIHDAARPFCSPRLMKSVTEAAREYYAATAGLAAVDSAKRVADDFITESIDRAGMYSVQTPQAAATDLLTMAHAAAVRDDFVADDDAALLERIGVRVRIVAGERSNLKITVEEDLLLMEGLIAAGERVAHG